ncbi:TetR/AcrR family transcriptional regulator [Streptomyces sp. DSM 44915]|uniref:TetR/AcrR family transcriptional regulator n=1 Tax=Streptomyces chisholmiae TaxID=3075540 RepID=A0ABU2JYX9_9ACTN|nr:TetR/AcrR family transcriptional regulator [Streptomyces sp. DSM 44915]MDT0270205.1 TetR/AcrR family transcriptional regulator [Streptomyces sp. DSM 44915]
MIQVLPSDSALLDAAAQHLSRNRSAALGEVARAAGVSRATLHRRWPTREALLRAVGERSIAVVDELLAEAELPADAAPEAFDPALDRFIDGLAPAIHLYGFTCYEPQLLADPELSADVRAQDERALRFFAHGQRLGRLRPDLPAAWLWHSLWGLLESAAYGVDEGQFGRREVRRLVTTTYRTGNQTESH